MKKERWLVKKEGKRKAAVCPYGPGDYMAYWLCGTKKCLTKKK